LLNIIHTQKVQQKFYNLETGTIANQQHIASLVEDYWMPSQGGQRGTTIDTIDETGNLGELGDIIHIKKIYPQQIKTIPIIIFPWKQFSTVLYS
jgi:hypothetical protein